MSLILGIDPGNTHSAFAMIDDHDGMQKAEIVSFKKLENSQAELWLSMQEWMVIPVCEMIAFYGMAVGQSVFDTCVQIGTFREIAKHKTREMQLVTRKQVACTICHSAKANDSNIRQALIDRYGPPGTKKNPGPTYGISKDMWAALAVATAYADGAKLYEFSTP